MVRIDVENDLLVPVTTEAKRRTGKRPSPATIWRWTRKGCRGIRLEAIQFSGQWHTTREAFADFIRRQSAAAMTGCSDGAGEGEERSPEMTAKLRAAGVL